MGQRVTVRRRGKDTKAKVFPKRCAFLVKEVAPYHKYEVDEQYNQCPDEIKPDAFGPLRFPVLFDSF